MAGIDDLVVIDSPDERLILTSRGRFAGQVRADDEGGRWSALTTADDLARFHDATEVLGSVAEALAAAFPALNALDAPGTPEADAVRELALDEPLRAVVVRTYSGRTQDDAAMVFAADAAEMGALGYVPVSQSWADGRPGVGRMLAIGVFSLAARPNGTLTVTYRLDR